MAYQTRTLVSWGGAAWVLLLLVVGCQNASDPSRSADADTSSPTIAPDTTSNAPSSGDTDDPATGTAPANLDVPDGMVYVPSGSTQIGIKTERWQQLRRSQPAGPRPLFGKDAHPPFWAEVDAFFLDVHPVTVAQFQEFVDETGYTTQAENFGNAGALKNGQWQLVKGATWHHPRGPNQPAAPDDHPVTQVSWNDAQSYCEWAGKRLPTEVEWEHAAREGRSVRALCPWDGSCRERKARIEHANTWQGRYPAQNTAADGYRYTAPVGTFGANALGLQGMSGNVWEWTASWKRPYENRNTAFQPTKRSNRVLRGGSFICRECGGYYVFARSGATPRTSLFHVGIRCAKDISDMQEGRTRGASGQR